MGWVWTTLRSRSSNPIASPTRFAVSEGDMVPDASPLANPFAGLSVLARGGP